MVRSCSGGKCIEATKVICGGYFMLSSFRSTRSMIWELRLMTSWAEAMTESISLKARFDCQRGAVVRCVERLGGRCGLLLVPIACVINFQIFKKLIQIPLLGRLPDMRYPAIRVTDHHYSCVIL